jgi:hypothetical protein
MVDRTTKILQINYNNNVDSYRADSIKSAGNISLITMNNYTI